MGACLWATTKKKLLKLGKTCFQRLKSMIMIIPRLLRHPNPSTSWFNLYMVQFATFQDFWIWVGPNRFYSGFSTELSFNLFVKRKDVLESQMASKSFTWKIMTMGRGYLPELLRFIWTFFKNVSTSDQNYHILKVDTLKTKVVIRN